MSVLAARRSTSKANYLRIETDRNKISQHTEAILTTVEPDTLQLINVWFKNQIKDLAQRVNKILEELHGKNTIH